MTIAREWDGATYDRISGPMEAMGLEVLARLELRGDETVVDAGCGSGRITAALLERLPSGHVIGVDGAPSMIEAARERLGERANLELRVADLCELELDEPADAILSTATFHWIKDHAQLFGRLRAALREADSSSPNAAATGTSAPSARPARRSLRQPAVRRVPRRLGGPVALRRARRRPRQLLHDRRLRVLALLARAAAGPPTTRAPTTATSSWARTSGACRTSSTTRSSTRSSSGSTIRA